MIIDKYEIYEVTEKELKKCKKFLKKHKQQANSLTLETYMYNDDLLSTIGTTRDIIKIAAEVFGKDFNMTNIVLIGEGKEDKYILKIHDKIVQLAWEPKE